MAKVNFQFTCKPYAAYSAAELASVKAYLIQNAASAITLNTVVLQFTLAVPLDHKVNIGHIVKVGRCDYYLYQAKRV